jgi:hypothetical protein
MKRKSFPVGVLLFTAAQPLLLTCTAAPAAGEASAAPQTPSVSPSSTAAQPTAGTGPAEPWLAVRGGAGTDQAWGVDTDSRGNIYWATFQQPEHQPFADMVIYKFAPDGTELWQSRWGGRYMEKAFIVTVAEPFVYVGGLTYTSPVDLMQADMAVLALNTDDGRVAWDFTWGRGFGYEEVDGLVVDGESIFLSGWTTGEKTGVDVAILKLDLQGNLLWVNSWGSDGWDQGDGQMVVDDDAIYVCGRYNGSNILLGGQGLLVRFSKADGGYEGHTVWDGPFGTDALGMASDGTHLYTVGLTVDRGDGGQIFVRKWDKEFRLIWERLWGGTGSEEARAIAVGPQGDLFIAGASDSLPGAGQKDIVLLRYDRDGALIRQLSWGGPYIDAAHGISVDEDRILIAGNVKHTAGGFDDAILISAGAEAGRFPSFPG